MKYNLSEIMKRAWEIKKKGRKKHLWSVFENGMGGSEIP